MDPTSSDRTPSAPPDPASPVLARAVVPERLTRTALKLAFELVVVFIGVYAASAVARYQERQAVAERRHQVRLALVSEIEGITPATRRVARNLERALPLLDSAIVAGQRPPLQPMLEPVHIDAHLWNATLQSGGLDLLDVPTVYRLSEFYNGLTIGFEQIEQLRRLSETMILPNLDRGHDEFYDPGTKRLRAKYAWYPAGLRNLQVQAALITARGDSLVAEFRRSEARAGRRAAPVDSGRTADSARPR